MNKRKIDTQIVPFIFFYAAIYMCTATFGPYLTIYYKSLGYALNRIGVLTALGPLVSIAAQPVWGVLSDRTNKKRVLMSVIVGAACASLLYALKTDFVYIAVMAVLYNGFYTSIMPLGDAMTLQFIEHKAVKFSSIRLVGTVSYAIMVAVVGRLLHENVRLIFLINASLLGIALAMACWMPRVTRPSAAHAIDGTVHDEKNTWANLKALFHNKLLVCVFLASFVFGLTMNFYQSFIGIRLTELGAGTEQVGVAMLIAASSEIPVLLLVNRVFSKLSPVRLLMLVGALLGIRMVVLYNSLSVETVYAAQLLHGLTFMIPYYFSVLLINQNAPDGLKSTAQSVYTMFRNGFASLLGSVGGGQLAEIVGIRRIYLFLAVFVIAICCVLPVIALWMHRLKGKRTNGG